jgi:lauroyl/myristoyl acyltransferase
MRRFDRHPIMARALGPTARLLSPLLPKSWHPGKRALDALANLDGHPVTNPAFAGNVLASQWRCGLLRDFAERAELKDLADFLATRVTEAGPRPLSSLAMQDRPVILAAPHYGAYVVGCMAAMQRYHGKKPFHVFYDDPARNPHNAGFDKLFRRAGFDVEILLNNRRGLVSALKALRRGGCLALMPDVFHNISETISVPVLGRLLRVMTGTAFFSLKCDALIVPAYALPGDDFSVELRSGQVFDPRDYAHLDEDQAMFLLTRDLFADIAEHLRLAPQHWIFWENFAVASTSIGVELGRTEAIEQAIARRCREIPQLYERMPALSSLRLGS